MEYRKETGKPRSFLLALVVNTLSVIIAAFILRKGVHLESALTALWVALILALLNATIKPILILLTLPLTLFSFGLFLLVINVIVIYMTESLISGFQVDGFWWALFFSLLLSIVNGLLYALGGRK